MIITLSYLIPMIINLLFLLAVINSNALQHYCGIRTNGSALGVAIIALTPILNIVQLILIVVVIPSYVINTKTNFRSWSKRDIGE